jgi:surfactin synthase thioesterase subunit/acyl carrier protein
MFGELVARSGTDDTSSTAAVARPIPRERDAIVSEAPKHEPVSVGTDKVIVAPAQRLRSPAGSASSDTTAPGLQGRASSRFTATASVAAGDGERAGVHGIVQRLVMAELGFTEAIDADRPLNEVGLDSLMAVKLANSLEKEFGTPVAVAELLRGPTINQLVDLVAPGEAIRHAGDPAKTSTGHADTLQVRAPIADSSTHVAAEAHTPPDLAPEGRNGRRFHGGTGLQQAISGRAPAATATISSATESASQTQIAGIDKEAPPVHSINGSTTDHFRTPLTRSSPTASGSVGKWLIAPQPNPNAKARLFCFPYAGGGLVSFRPWSQLIDDTVELVAVEPPGRGTRITEAPIDELDVFVERLLTEMLDWLDRPAAFFGHCLGGLTMVGTLSAISGQHAQFIKHCFACGVRPPHLLKRRGRFEDELIYDIMLHRDFDVSIPPYAQADEIFADIIRHFDIEAANKMLETPKLRALLLPTVRAEFKMAYCYEYQPAEPFACPISSFVGQQDPWVSAEDSAGWSKLTRGTFRNHVRNGTHFLMADDRDYILETIKKEFVDPLN